MDDVARRHAARDQIGDLVFDLRALANAPRPAQNVQPTRREILQNPRPVLEWRDSCPSEVRIGVLPVSGPPPTVRLSQAKLDVTCLHEKNYTFLEVKYQKILLLASELPLWGRA
jgi:hypothetical protein